MSVSIKNSTSTPLNAGQTWTGSAEDCLAWSSLTINFTSDADTDITLQFSSQGSDWDFPSVEALQVPGGAIFTNSFRVLAKYFRIVLHSYDGSNATYTRLQTILQKTEPVVEISSMPPVVLDPGALATEATLANVLTESETSNSKLEQLHTDLTGTLQVAQNPLAHGTDSVLIYGNDAGTPLQRPISVDSTGQVNVVCTANSLDIRVLSAADDSVMAYGFDGSNIRQLKTDVAGRLDTLATCTQSGSWSVGVTDEALAFRSLDVQPSSIQVGSTNVRVCSIFVQNDAGAHRYLKLYNDTSADETYTPAMTLPLPTKTVMNIPFPIPLKFVNGLCLRATTGLADNDTGAPSTNDVIVNIAYKT